MKFRQVHLDFHTSEHIPDIGAKFDKEQFQAALRAGHVDSITVFSKCHHGWSYHPTEANVMHPHLSFDLLGAQIEAAHEIGVNVPVYISAGYDEKTARQHPEWLVHRMVDGQVEAPDFTRPMYHYLCLNTAYLDELLAQIKEMLSRYDADGLFLDIVNVLPCCCETCRAALLASGKDPENEADVLALAEQVYANYTRRVRETVDSVKPGLPVFHNGGHIRTGRRDLAHMNTHLELESLPTGGWGYDHFPMSAAYARTLGMDFLGMTGKFHRSWGEFGGFKHPNALRYETALSVANGACCSVGDQLHPSGEMDMATYQLIGAAYAEVEAKEPWLAHAKHVADVAVFTSEAASNYYKSGAFRSEVTSLIARSDTGCTRMLLEGHYLFDVLDIDAAFDGYKVIILPDAIRVAGRLQEKLAAFVAGGGKVLATGESGLAREDDAFVLDFGADYAGRCSYQPSYVRPRFALRSPENAAFVLYAAGHELSVRDGEVLADRVNPYFNRTVDHFCSHLHTPPNMADTAPGMVSGKDGIYIGWNLFEEYAEQGCLAAKEIFCHALDQLLGKNKSIETTLPAQGVVALTRQAGRYVSHLLYASPVKRGRDVEVIEDILPLHDVQVCVRVEGKVTRVYLAPQEEDIPFVQEGNRVTFAVPSMENHQMVAMELA